MFKKLIPLLYFSLAILLPALYLVSCSPSEEVISVTVDTFVIKKTDTVFIQTDSARIEQNQFDFNLTIQLASYDNLAYAESFALKAKETLNSDVEISEYLGKYTIITGKFDAVRKAEAYLGFVKSKGFNEAFIRSK